MRSSEQKTVRVRIAVAVDKDGDWRAWGDVEEVVVFGGEALHWVEADIPLPQPQTVEGEVVA